MRFAEAGARVLVTAADVAVADGAAQAVRARGGTAAALAVDPARDEDWARAVEKAEAEFAGLDILVVASSTAAPTPTQALRLQDFRGHVSGDLRGPFLALRQAAAAMRRRGRGGSIALLGSVAAKTGVRDRLHDAAAQGGLRMLAKATALELGPDRIRVNSIHAGLGPDSPLGQGPSLADLAEAALFLASDRSVFMTGAELLVDGGWSAQ